MTPIRIIISPRGLRSQLSSIRAVSPQDSFGCSQKDFDVEPRRPNPCVLEVQTDHVIKFDPASTFHLPQARDSRLGLKEAAPVPDIVGFNFVRNRWPWSDQGHITLQYVEELGKLVQAGFRSEEA